ncbi:RNA dependent RNA polymerase-domain-containing protein [Schizophyllum amplum]|uniref:RNA-dependent RNA polymerase n=1 Tax=Schizophyllum amplum TaxID=97359 RepID=A0A550C944_9AGAR|nr:RNA dependent RNA polymerase-domain-containing protein [Auriculariopsis ampla]
MEIFMRNISYSTSQPELEQRLADILHDEPYVHMSGLPLNFRVRLFKRPGGLYQHRGQGALTLPSEEIGQTFLEEWGERPGHTPPRMCYLPDRTGRPVKFTVSKYPPNALEERTDFLQHSQVDVSAVQFGWECFDEGTVSIEWEEAFQDGDAYLTFDDERREMRVSMRHPSARDSLLSISMRFPQINYIYAPRHSPHPAITISLSTAPSFETKTTLAGSEDAPRQRLPCLPFGDHKRVVGFTSLALRLELPSTTSLSQFYELAEVADLHHLYDSDYPAVRKNLFAATVLERIQEWEKRLPWCVAFQVESLLRSLQMDPTQLLRFRPKIDDMYKQSKKRYCAQFLKYLQSCLTAYMGATIDECFDCAVEKFAKQNAVANVKPADASIFDSLHVIITPTAMILEGPFPERSNRIIRMFPSRHHDSFLRVSFVDEGRLQYRFDREVDGRTFISDRVGTILKQGLFIGGRKFEFLAYSQAALKEHAVWFVRHFRPSGQRDVVTSASIISGIGNFENSRDRFCPARYAARLSQAFTATDASVHVKSEHIEEVDDISTHDNAYVFTDGVGTMSPAMAMDTYAELCKTKRAKERQAMSAALQVRIMGAKGMLSVDHELSGRVVRLRPSMIKFEAENSRVLEIARSFDRPGKYYLNRPLIMLLEGLGIRYETFLRLQNLAVEDAHSAKQSLARAARMLESFGLGTSFRLTSIMLSLRKLGIENLPDDAFYGRMLDFAINHVLRELKNHARIPVPDAYTLVGVADVNKELKEGEIFACVKPHDSSTVMYLEGDILISRSPTIHPGDVQVIRAIGRPRNGSCFAREPLCNTVVFSVQGAP